MFYVVSLAHTSPKEKYVTLWRPNNAGYCYSKQNAGSYEVPTPGYHDSERNMPITQELAESLFVDAPWDNEIRKMIPNTPEVWTC